MPVLLGKRQSWGADPDWNSSWWFSSSSEVIRYAIVGVIVAIILLFVIGGYLHAVSRLRKKQEPLAYHRWLVSNATRRRHGMDPITYGGRIVPQNLDAVPTEQWDMGRWNYPEPPPVYNAPVQAPPEYFPSANVDSSIKGQPAAHVTVAHETSGEAEHYTPPAGPPPSHQPPPVYK